MIDSSPRAVMQEAARMARPLASVKAGRKSVSEHQVHVFKRMDEAMAAVRIPPQHSLACKKGCSYCCHYHVYISAAEALVLGAHVQQLKEPAKTALLGLLKGNADLAAHLGPAAHIATNVRCAFLGEAGECNVYEIRPSACRRHHSFDVTPCRVTFEDPTRSDTLQMSQDLVMALEVVRSGDVAASLQTGVDILRYEMSGAVLAAATDDQAFVRWARGQVTFPTVQDRTDPMKT